MGQNADERSMTEGDCLTAQFLRDDQENALTFNDEKCKEGKALQEKLKDKELLPFMPAEVQTGDESFLPSSNKKNVNISAQYLPLGEESVFKKYNPDVAEYQYNNRDKGITSQESMLDDIKESKSKYQRRDTAPIESKAKYTEDVLKQIRICFTTGCPTAKKKCQSHLKLGRAKTTAKLPVCKLTTEKPQCIASCPLIVHPGIYSENTKKRELKDLPNFIKYLMSYVYPIEKKDQFISYPLLESDTFNPSLLKAPVRSRGKTRSVSITENFKERERGILRDYLAKYAESLDRNLSSDSNIFHKQKNLRIAQEDIVKNAVDDLIAIGTGKLKFVDSLNNKTNGFEIIPIKNIDDINKMMKENLK